MTLRMELPVISRDDALALDEIIANAGADANVVLVRGVWTVNATFEPSEAAAVGRAITDFTGGWS